MECFIFDVESTGLTTRDEVIQFSGFRTDINFKLKGFVNFYCSTNVMVHPGALAVHGLTNKAVYELSKGRTLEDNLSDCDFIWKKNIVFIHYSSGLDVRMTNGTLESNGCVGIDFGRKVATLPTKDVNLNYNLSAIETLNKHFGNPKWKSLTDIVNTRLTKYKQSDLESIFDMILKSYGYNSSMFPQRYHNSAFDSFILWFLMNEYRSFHVL